MPPSEQEERCIRAALGCLGTCYGGSWRIDRILDEQYPSERSPEVFTTNGDKTAAIEVKQLIDPGTQELVESLRSNERYLTPSCGGYYVLSTPFDVHHRLPRTLRRYLKKEVERVAPTLGIRESGAVRVLRTGSLKCVHTRPGWHHLSCYHYGPQSGLLSPLSERIDGCFFLDDRNPEHSFVTETGREQFYAVIASVCQGCRDGETATVEWYEEWKLTKVREHKTDEQDGVWLLAVSDVVWVEEATPASIREVLDKARGKFDARRWAQYHVLVIDWAAILLDTAPETIESLQPQDLGAIDIVLLVRDGEVVAHSMLAEL